MSRKGKRYVLITSLSLFVACGGAATLFLVLGPVSVAVPLTEEEYRSQLDSLPYADRLGFAAGTLLGGADESVALRALRDIMETSTQLERTGEALATVEQYLAGLPEGSQAYQDAYYVRARLIHRFDKAQAEALFREGISRGWKMRDRASPFRAFKDSLWHNDPPSYAVECFNRPWPTRQGSSTSIRATT
jgi:hypothetical protein